MADREWLDEKQSSTGVEVHIWGRHGVKVRQEIERELDVVFDEQLASFVETVGNAGIGGFMVLIAGSDDAAWNCITETKRCRGLVPQMPADLVQIMDNGAGSTFFYNANSGEVEVFESVPLNPDPHSRMRVFAGFDKFLEWAFEEAKLQSEDNEFAF